MVAAKFRWNADRVLVTTGRARGVKNNLITRCGSAWGRLWAPPVAEEANKKEWQWLDDWQVARQRRQSLSHNRESAWREKQFNNEVWLSLVERYVRDVEVASSNLVTSTISSVHNTSELWTLDFFLLVVTFSLIFNFLSRFSALFCFFTFIFSYFICLISPSGIALLRHTLFESINLYKGYLTSLK